MRNAFPECHVHSCLDSYSTLDELMDLHVTAIDLQMTPFPPVHIIVFLLDCSGGPCSEPSTPAREA